MTTYSYYAELESLRAENATLRAAIEAHHAARSHERCWLNDLSLYRVAGLTPADPQLPSRDEFRRECQRYEAGLYDARHLKEHAASPAGGEDDGWYEPARFLPFNEN